MIIFAVLMWKNLLVRSRRLLRLAFELVLPLFFVIVMARSNLPQLCDEQINDPFKLVRASLQKNAVPQIVYTPENKPTKMLMDEVTDALNIPRFKSVPADYERVLSQASSDENSKMFRALEKVDAVVVFENFHSNETLPDKLNYTLYLKEQPSDTIKNSLRSSKLWRSIYNPAGELDESFLKLQWAINSRFIKMKSETSFELQKLVLRHLKYPKASESCGWIKYFIMYAYLFFTPMLSFVLIMLHLNEERCNGIEALLEVFGVPWFIIDITNLLDSLLPCLFITLVATLLFPMNSDYLIIFMCLCFHHISLITFAFACSNLTLCGTNVASTALFVYLGFFLLDLAIWPFGTDQLSLRLKGLLPHAPAYWYMYQFFVREFYRIIDGIHFNIWSKTFVLHLREKSKYKHASVKLSVEMLLIQIALFFILSLFFRLIRPKKYGKTLEWNFLFKKSFWVRRVNHMPSSNSNHHPAYDRYFEDPPNDLDVAVEVVNVKKTYYSKFTSTVALNDVSLKMYRGEITVIVGHNGSGKTTLLSIIAGMIQQFSGKVFVERVDTKATRMKNTIAFCPQKNILFPQLSVEEHLNFFSMIAGDPQEGPDRTTERVMTLMDLIEVQYLRPSALTIGMQRRLQIACTLCSQSRVILLDDPTSEIDVEARRDLYQVLATLRGERTIILTTNFLEEANLLGDRVAALQRGVLRCFASPQFLKKAIDSGSRVNITSFQPTDSDIVTRVIRGAAPDTTLSENVMGTLIYNVPPGSNMVALFDTLEANRDAIDIESVGVGPVSLDEAFMKLCSDGETDTSTEQERVLKKPDIIYHTDGLSLFWTQMRELFRRQLDYTYSRLLAFILLHFIGPVCLLILMFILFHRFKGPFLFPPDIVVEMRMLGEENEPLATYRIKENDLNKTQRTIQKMKEIFPQLVVRAEEEGPEKACNCTKCGKYGHKSRNIFDIYIDPQNARLNYDRDVKYAAMVGLNVLSNIIAAQQVPHQTNKTITMRVGGAKWEGLQSFSMWTETANKFLFPAFIIFVFLIPIIDDVALPCNERTSNTRYYHIMAGCPPWLYWLVTFIYHIAYKVLILVPTFVFLCAIMDYETVSRRLAFIRAFFLCLVLITISFYTLAYLISQCVNEEATKLILITLITIGLFCYVHISLAELITMPYDLLFHHFFIITRVINPVATYTGLIREVLKLGIVNDICQDFEEKQRCERGYAFQSIFFIRELCCNRIFIKDYGRRVDYFFDTPWTTGINMQVITTTAFIVIASILVVLLEYRLFRKLWNKHEQRKSPKLPFRKYESNDVAAEKEYIKNTVMRAKETIKESVLVSKAWKIFFRLQDEPVFVLKDINFSVRKGECFGFVGLNASGKSSVLKAMTHQFLITRGLMYADGYFSHEETASYLKGLGYCPHSSCLDNFRTGCSNIRMMMCLRGVHIDEVTAECDAWQRILGLDRFRQTLVGEYSSGMERRLSLGTAMCRSEHVLLLDQPLSGVDVGARRQLWAVMERALANGCAIVHASHNLEILDRMCNQLTILDGGEMAALGAPSDYKRSYAFGHSVILKLRPDVDYSSSGGARVKVLKDYMHHEFNCFLRDDLLLYFQYIVKERMRYSAIYEKLNSTANEFKDIVEEFIVHDSNLEDAFLQFINDSRYSVRPNETW